MTEAFSTQWLKGRNKALARTGDAIDEAHRMLDQIEQLYRDASLGQIPDVGLIVDVCHALGEAKNKILIGFVESNIAPADGCTGDS